MKNLTQFTVAFILVLTSFVQSFSQSVSFTSSSLKGVTLSSPTSLQFGPDNRLYLAQVSGNIYAFTITRNGPNDYEVTNTETILLVKNIPNYNDDGTLNTSVKTRQITGLLATGTPSNPVLYVSSSDPRIGGGGTAGDQNLDTNSGIVSKLTWNGSSWDKVDVVIGLPRSEENHSVNGMQLDAATNTLYLAVGGITNAGAPSNNFAFLTEFALSAAILKIDLTKIQNEFGGSYTLPTLDDPNRANTGPNGADVNDPFGGNDGLNQAKLVVGGPVQIHSPGYRNPYDIVITKTPGKQGRMYTIDNGPNGGWGGYPDKEGASGNPLTTSVTNNYVVGEPGSTTAGANDAKVNNKDNLHLVSKPGLNPIYGGHPNPIRANPAGAGLYWYNNTTSTATFSLTPTTDWPPVPLSLANPVEGDFRNPGVNDGALYTWDSSTNGIAEYTSEKFFNGLMAGDLLAASFDGNIYRIKPNEDGTAVSFVEPIASGFGSIPLDVVAQGASEIFEGSVWVATFGSDEITILEPEGAWQEITTVDDSAPVARHENSFVEADGKFYLLGGRETSTLNIYDPALRIWSTGAKLPFIMHHFQAVSWQSKIYVMGAYAGFYQSGNLNNSEYPVEDIYIYDIATDTWSKGSAIPRPRGSASLVVYNNEFYMMGGIVNGHVDGWVTWVDKYNPTTDTWTQLADAPRERDHATAALVNGKVYLAGGRKTNANGDVYGVTIAEVDVYDLVTNTWTTLPSSSNVITQRAGTSTVVLNGEIYLLGGESPNQSIAHKQSEIFNPTSGTWRQSANLITGRHGTGALVSNGTIYIAAGSANKGGGPPLTSMESYSSTTNCSGEINSLVLDDDNDGYTNGDETLNKTNPCSAASAPTDFDDDQISDLSDTDDDNDGILDVQDLFALDDSNGMNTTIPLYYPLLNGDPGKGLFGLGFTGLMNNGTDNYQNLFDPNDPDLIMGGAVGIASVPANGGDALTNDQEYAFQLGFKINPASGIFTVKSKLQGTPFFDGIALNLLQNQSQGIFVGTGDQDNYLKLALTANAGNPGILVVGENAGTVFVNQTYPITNILSTGILFLSIEINPITKEARLYYQTGTDATRIAVGTAIALPSAFTNLLNGSSGMALGLIASSGTAPAFSASWDYLSITTSSPFVNENTPSFYNRFVGNPTTPLTLDLTKIFSDNDGAANLTYELVSVETNTFINSSTLTGGILNINFLNSKLGSAKVIVKATDVDLLAVQYEFLVQVIPQPTPFTRINTGGNSFGSWSADNYFSGGGVYSRTVAIANTTDDLLYQTERFGNTFTYAIPVSKTGYYRVNLHFAEIYHGIQNGLGIGARVFDVEAENKKVLTNYDIFKAAGGHSKAIIEKIDSVQVLDGFLTLKFNRVVDNAKISAIELAEYTVEAVPNTPPFVENPGNRYIFEGGSLSIPVIASDFDFGDVLQYQATGLPASLTINQTTGLISGTIEVNKNTFPVVVTVSDNNGASTQVNFNINVVDPPTYSLKINSGGVAKTYGTEVWEGDQFFLEGRTFSSVNDITNTTKDDIYQSERFGTKLTYQIPMPGVGRYNVTLHFAEIYWTEPGKRVFNVDIESGKASLTNYDVFQKAGGINRAITESFTVDVADGFLTILLTALTDQAKISGIEISSCVSPIVASFTSSAAICKGATATLTVSGNLGGASIWSLYTGSCGGSLVASNTTGIFEVSPSVTTTYYVRGEGGCVVPATCASVDVVVKNVNTTVTLAVETLTATLSNATYQWIDCNGNADIAGATNQSFTPTESGTYSVRITSNGCTEVSSCTAVTVCKKPAITTFVTSATDFCLGGSATLTVTGDLKDATAWHLYTGSCGGTLVESNATGIFVVAPTATTTYYVRGEGGCVIPATCTSVEVVVKNVDKTVTLSGETLTASLSNATYQWINCDGNTDITGATNQSFSPEQSGNYAVRITFNGCTVVSSCTSVAVCNEPVITTFVGSSADICLGGSATLTVTGNLKDATAWHLYTGSCGGTLVTSNTTGVFVVSPTATTTYFVRGEGGCVVAGSCSSLQVNVKTVNTAVTTSGTTLTASATGATYQWINCNGNTNIAGETSQSFTPQQSGSYAVKVTAAGCTATSACVNVVIVGIEESISEKVIVYPNPATDKLTIDLPMASSNVVIDITDVAGRSAWNGKYEYAKTVEVDTRELNPGVYLLRVKSTEIKTVIKVIIR
ncbi:MAG: hypothetical protein RI909_535 [Bacteroidota bacterium]